jgi:hypothetical protein
MTNLSIAAKILSVSLILSGIMPLPIVGMQSLQEFADALPKAIATTQKNQQQISKKTVWQTLFRPTDAQRCDEQVCKHGAELLEELKTQKTLLFDRKRVGPFIHLTDPFVLTRQYVRAQLEINTYDFLRPLSCVAGFAVGAATYVGLGGLFSQAQSQAQTLTPMHIAAGAAAVTTGAILGYRHYRTRPFTQFQKRFIEDCNKQIFVQQPVTHDWFIEQAHERELLSPRPHRYDNMGGHHCQWN